MYELKPCNISFELFYSTIVVAIIAVLVAIAIPVFNSQLEKSREATDAANLRSAYAAGSIAVLEKEGEVYAGPVKMTQKTSGFASDIKDQKIGSALISTCAGTADADFYVKVETSGTTSFVAENDVVAGSTLVLDSHLIGKSLWRYPGLLPPLWESNTAGPQNLYLHFGNAFEQIQRLWRPPVSDNSSSGPLLPAFSECR